MNNQLTFEVPGLPPVETDARKTAALVAVAKDFMKRTEFAIRRNEGVRLEIEFHSKPASGFSDPLVVISGIVRALEKSGLFASRTAIRDLGFIRKTGAETKYVICVSNLGVSAAPAEDDA